MMPVVAEINALEPAIQALDDAALRGKTDELRKRLADGAEIEDVLPEAFAVCREAARRSVGMRHFDVQLIGGMVLHNGTIAEDRKSTRLNSSHGYISYAGFCLKKKKRETALGDLV